jgi:hypothetical protein
MPTIQELQPVQLDDLADVRETLRLAKEEQAKWKAVADAAAEKIKERMGDAEIGTIAGREAVRFKHRTVTRLNTTKMRADMGDELLAQQGYLTTTTERRFEIVD